MLKKWKVENFTLSNEKNIKNIPERSSTLRVSRAKIWLTVYRSIYIRMQEGIDSYWARALKYFFLPCDLAGKIISSYNNKVYHSESKFIWMRCVMISDLERWQMKGFGADQISKKMSNIFLLKILLCLTKIMKKIWMGLQLYVSSERKSGWRFTARFTFSKSNTDAR